MRALLASADAKKIDAAERALLEFTGKRAEVVPAPEGIFAREPEPHSDHINDVCERIERDFRIIRQIGDFSCYIAVARSDYYGSLNEKPLPQSFAMVGTPNTRHHPLGLGYNYTEAILAALFPRSELKEIE